MKKKLLVVLLAFCVAVLAVSDVVLFIKLNQSSEIRTYSGNQSETQETVQEDDGEQTEQPTVNSASMDGFIVSRTGASENKEEEDRDKEDADYILPESDSKYYTKEDLDKLTREEVKLARNEIYARHGRIFTKDMTVKEYFEGKDWYEGTVDEVSDSELNKYEIANRDLIVKYEKEKNWN